MATATDVLQYPVQFLCAVRDTDREYQERHQYGIRIQLETEQGQQTELPDHRTDRDHDHHQRAAPAARVPVQQQGRDDHCSDKKQHHVEQAVDQLANDLGKTDDMQLYPSALEFVADILFEILGDLVRDFLVRLGETFLEPPLHGFTGVLELRAHLFELAAELVVVEALAGFRIEVHQRNQNRRGLFVVGNQVAAQAGARHVQLDHADGLRRSVVVRRYHRPALEALLGDHLVAGVGCPQGLEILAHHARYVKYRIAHIFQRIEKLRGIDGGLVGFHRQAQHIAEPFEILLVVLVVFDVGMVLRQHLLEACLEFQMAESVITEIDRHQRAQHHDEQPVIEDQALDQVPGVDIELRHITDDWQIAAVFNMRHRGLLLLIICPCRPAHSGNW